MRSCYRCFYKKDIVNFNIVAGIEIGDKLGECQQCLNEMYKAREDTLWHQVWSVVNNKRWKHA